LFDAKYIKSKGEWRMDKKHEHKVIEFLDCNSSEDEKGVCELHVEKEKEPRRKLRDRLHRSGSFNASDDSDTSVESVDSNYRRHRTNRRKFTRERKEVKQEADSYIN
jgi:hypothetical protein